MVPQPALAEGSRDMFPAGALGNRGNIVWKNNTAAGFRDRTLLRVYANAGEYILVGSSAVGVNNGDIEIFDPGSVTGSVANESLPGTADFACTTQTGRGFIADRSAELAGPESIDGLGNTAGYTPCFYQAASTGIYYVAMYGPSGKNSNSSPNDGVQPDITTLNTGNNQNTGISAWDVTVRDSQSAITDREGRLHTFFVSMNLGDNGRYLHSDLYPITTDGYRYEIDIRGLDPFGFRIFGNQIGNFDSDGATPLYNDVLGSNGDISNPSGGVSSAPPQYPIFFNPPDNAVLSYLPIYNPITGQQMGTGFPSSPVLPVVSAPSYAGDVGGNTSTVNVGGTFSFGSNLPIGNYEIVISRDGVDFDPANIQNRVLRGVMLASGTQTVTWDGQDNTGQAFPVGTFDYTIEIRGGEYHFPLSDAENNASGGPTYTLLNATNPLGNTTAFYDHRGYYTSSGTVVEDRDPGDGDPIDDALCGSDPPALVATDLITGADSSSATFNRFGQSSGGNTNARCTGAFGDTKTLDLWTYFPATTSALPLQIVEAANVDYGDAPDPSAGTGVVDYSTLEANNGASHAIGSAALYLGTSVSADTDGFVEGVDNNGNATDDNDDAFSSLTDAPQTGVYQLNNIPVQNSTSENATLHAWIDFDRNGRFEADEHQSATVAPGAMTASLSWNIPPGTLAGETYVRFRLTTTSLRDLIASTSDQDERSVGRANDGEVEDYLLTVAASDPDVLLVKRITAINGGQTTLVGDNLAQHKDETDNPYDDNTIPPVSDPGSSSYDPDSPSFVANETDQWPTPLSTYLVGGTDGGAVVPDDEIEYTIYFLSTGGIPAENVRFCDYIPSYMTFSADSFNGNAAALGSLAGADLGIEIFRSGVSEYHTGAIDGDAVTYFPPGVDPASDSRFAGIDCEGDRDGTNANPNGAIAVDLGDLTNASVATSVQDESYGYVRFRARVQ
ncbi:MAG: GEVED domain-containing protein [Cyanobacteria bacterium P01_D01_bin.14]